MSTAQWGPCRGTGSSGNTETPKGGSGDIRVTEKCSREGPVATGWTEAPSASWGSPCRVRAAGWAPVPTELTHTRHRSVPRAGAALACFSPSPRWPVPPGSLGDPLNLGRHPHSFAWQSARRARWGGTGACEVTGTVGGPSLITFCPQAWPPGLLWGSLRTSGMPWVTLPCLGRHAILSL